MSTSDDSALFPTDRLPTIRVLAMPADTNPAGHIFGGWIMAQMDIAGGVVAAERSSGRVATVAVTSMEFHRPVFVGDVISCFAEIEKIGNRSLTVRVEVFAQRRHPRHGAQCVKVTAAVIVYVALHEDGTPRTVTPI